jgi:O-antigen/teichoic acid export membrane protein
MSISAAIAQIATLLAGIVVANAIGTEDFGTYSFLLGSLTSWAQVATLSSGLLATRYLAAFSRTDPERAGEVVGYCTAMTALAGCIAGVILFSSRAYLIRNVSNPDALNSGLICVSIIVPFMSLTLFQSGALVGLEKYRIQAALSAFQSIVFVLGPFIGAKSNGSVGATMGFAAAVLFRFISQRIALVHVSATLNIRSRYTGVIAMSRLFVRFALPASLTGLTAGASLWLSSLVLVEQPNGTHDMGLFAAAQYFRLFVLFLPVQISTIGVPLLTRHLTGGLHAQYATLLRAGTMLTAAIACVVAITFAFMAPVLLHIFGPTFVVATNLARLLLIGAVIEAITGAMYQALPSREQMWRSFLIVALPRDFAFLIGSWLLVPRYLSVGLGSALLISQCVGFLGVIAARMFRMPKPRAHGDFTK